MSDGEVKIWDGKVLIGPAGQVATADECCCPPSTQPCVDCNGDDWPQPDAVISATGPCLDASGVYTFLSFEMIGSPPYYAGCVWQWTMETEAGTWTLEVGFLYGSPGWAVGLLRRSDNPGGTYFAWQESPQMSIFCSGTSHKLIGTFILEGMFETCLEGYATVTLG